MSARKIPISENGEYYWELRNEFGTTKDNRECSLCGQEMNPGDDMKRIVTKIDGELVRTHICFRCHSTYK